MTESAPWPPLSGPGKLLGITSRMNFFALSTDAVPMRGCARPGIGETALSLAIAACALAVGEGWSTAFGVIWGALALGHLLFSHGSVTIADEEVTVTIRRLGRRTVCLREPMAHYVALRYRFEIHSFSRGAEGWHVLELVHRELPERNIPVFRSWDFAITAPWLARLGQALGLPTYEIAGGGTCAVQPEDIVRPLTEKTAWSPCPAPPAELDVRSAPGGSVITLPATARIERRGALIAAAILSPVAAALLLQLPPSGFPISLLLIATGILLFLLIRAAYRQGAEPPRQLTRLVLTANGLALDYRHFIPGRHRALIPWHTVCAVAAADGALTIRTRDALYVTRAGLTQTSVDWLRSAVVDAAHRAASGQTSALPT